MMALNQNNLPQYYYQYKPKGSPADFKYKGSAPTGELPKELNFALHKQNESKNFDIFSINIMQNKQNTRKTDELNRKRRKRYFKKRKKDNDAYRRISHKSLTWTLNY